MNQIYNAAMKAMDSCASIQKRALKSHLRSHLGLSSQDADNLVDEYRTIKDGCFNLAAEIFANELDSTLFDPQVFSQHPKLNDELKKAWINEAMMAQFR